MDPKFFNVLILGFGFMFLFTAFQTMGNVQKIVLDSIKTDDPNFNGDGYTSLAVIYAVFAIFNWLAPSVVSITGPRGAILIGSSTYCLFIISFLMPRTWLLYLTSGILGIGAAITWTGQGSFLSRCSDTNTISRNSGIFWAMLQASLFFGNLFVYFQFQGKKHIDESTRNLLFSLLIGIALLGVVFLLTLKRIKVDDDDQTITTGASQNNNKLTVFGEFKNAVKLFITRDMILLSFTFFYTGLELSFFSGVYSPSIGFTNRIGESAKQLVGLSGVCIGLGEVFGGVLFGLLGTKTNRLGRDPIVIIGFIVHILSFFLIFLNLPNDAPFGETDNIAFIDPPIPWIALICSALLGFGDSCFNTQIYSMLGGNFAKNSVAAFAIFKFTQSVAAAISFIYSSHLGLRIQMSILAIFGTIGTICFCYVEWTSRRKLKLLNELQQTKETDSTTIFQTTIKNDVDSDIGGDSINII